MDLSELVSTAIQDFERRTGVHLLRHHLTDEARRDLGLCVAGRIVVALGLVLGDGLPRVNTWAADLLRRQYLAEALLGVVKLALLHGLTADDLARTLGINPSDLTAGVDG